MGQSSGQFLSRDGRPGPALPGERTQPVKAPRPWVHRMDPIRQFPWKRLCLAPVPHRTLHHADPARSGLSVGHGNCHVGSAGLCVPLSATQAVAQQLTVTAATCCHLRTGPSRQRSLLIVSQILIKSCSLRFIYHADLPSGAESQERECGLCYLKNEAQMQSRCCLCWESDRTSVPWASVSCAQRLLGEPRPWTGPAFASRCLSGTHRH